MSDRKTIIFYFHTLSEQHNYKLIDRSSLYDIIISVLYFRKTDFKY